MKMVGLLSTFSTLLVAVLMTLAFALTFGFGTATTGHAAIKKLSDSLEQATKAEKKDLGKLLTGISLAPAVDPKTGRDVFKVGSVAKGSVYERTGIKAGDLVEMGYDGVDADGDLNISKKRTAKTDSNAAAE